MNKPLLIIGSGGHASVLVDILLQQGRMIIGLVSLEKESTRAVFSGLDFFQDEELERFSPKEVNLVNGLGSLPGKQMRAEIFESYLRSGFNFESVIADSAIVSKFVEIEAGVQILPGAIVQAGVKLGVNTIINSGAIIEHDCVIGANNHIAPGATLSGAVTTADYVHIGTGANLVQGIRVGEKAVVAAGCSVNKDVSSNIVIYGPRNFINKS